ncbi:MAG: DUF3800 domain-containing protein [Puia sp.]|nr:DUF3800 domain-containing protein [Puia sp.]
MEDRFANPSASALWGKFSGLHPARIASWACLMLRFVADDSSQPNPPIYVLGGYLAHLSDWAEFSTDWGNVLQAAPALSRLKTSNIRHELGSEKAANEKLSALYHVIEKHIKYAAAISIDTRIIKNVFDPKDKMSTHPFYAMASILITDVARMLRELGVQYSEIDFVFDDQMLEKGRFLDAWAFSQRTMANSIDQDIRKILKHTPIFANDEDMLPIQAADMLVWKIRRMYHQQRDKADISPIRWKSTDKVLHRLHTIDENGLRARAIALKAQS